MEDLRNRLQDAEKRVLENFELASQKDRQYEKEVNLIVISYIGIANNSLYKI